MPTQDTTCFICLESTPPLVHGGCSCRGEAGFAHLKCFVALAAQRAKAKKPASMCCTCNQMFHGDVAKSIASHFWDCTDYYAATWADALRYVMTAAYQLPSLRCVVQRELVRRFMQQFGPDHQVTLLERSMLAMTMLQRKELYDEGAAVYHDVLPRLLKMFPPHHSAVVQLQTTWARAEFRQGRVDEALAMQRQIITKNPKHSDDQTNLQTIGQTHQLAQMLLCCDGKSADLDKLREARDILQRELRVIKRVYGDHHEFTLSTVHLLDECRKTLGGSDNNEF